MRDKGNKSTYFGERFEVIKDPERVIKEGICEQPKIEKNNNLISINSILKLREEERKIQTIKKDLDDEILGCKYTCVSDKKKEEIDKLISDISVDIKKAKKAYQKEDIMLIWYIEDLKNKINKISSDEDYLVIKGENILKCKKQITEYMIKSKYDVREFNDYKNKNQIICEIDKNISLKNSLDEINQISINTYLNTSLTNSIFEKTKINCTNGYHFTYEINKTGITSFSKDERNKLSMPNELKDEIENYKIIRDVYNQQDLNY